MNNKPIHEQVQKQLRFLKYCVDAERQYEKNCILWGIPYVPSDRKWENERLYKDYLNEIETNGDKNLLVIMNMQGTDGLYGVYPFAKRYADDQNLLIHRTECGTEILTKRYH